ncbi:MAG: M28 family peptidase [Myxococcota bacterium]
MKPWLMVFVFCSCGEKQEDTGGGETTAIDLPLSEDVLGQISAERMRDAVDFLADDALGGRLTGSPGHAAAMEWIVQEMEDIGLEPVGLEGDFVYPYAATGPTDWYQLDADGGVSLSSADVAYDLVGRLPGADPTLAQEHILIMAHYDHLGVTDEGEIYNGAFDNASGVAVALELARVLSLQAPDRSILFLLTDEEETGLDGARAWLEDSTIPREQIVFGLSIDPVGRPALPDYWPILLIGTERSPELDSLWRDMAKWSGLPTLFLHRDLVPVFASDQDELYKIDPPIPGFWFVNPGFSFYHTVNDTPETIDYRILKEDVRFLANALTSAGAETQTYSFEAEPVLDGSGAADVKLLLEGLLSSEELTIDEREYANWVIGELDVAIETNDISVLGNLEGFTMAVAYFVMFQLGEAHPGPIPPPFPDEE